jgi:RNA-directed DNA polymerase
VRGWGKKGERRSPLRTADVRERMEIMPDKRADLFAAVASFQALRRAMGKAIRSKRKKPGAAAFAANRERELLRLSRELAALVAGLAPANAVMAGLVPATHGAADTDHDNNGTYRPGRYVEILIKGPKERLVSAAPFRDRVVHHALGAVVFPLFEAGFITHSYANRAGKGTHAAIATYERYRDTHKHVLRADIFRYFPSIDHTILKSLFRRRIACAPTLALMDLIVDGSNAQEPVDLHFPGDDLFSPFERRRGLPLGNLTSQFFANLYLDRFDHWVTEKLRAPYVRYVDDFALFHDDPAVLAGWRRQIEDYLVGRRLKLHPRKTMIIPTAQPSVFLGFELLPGGHPQGGRGLRRLPADHVARFRGRLRGLRDQLRAGTVTAAEVDAKISAWIAHASHADTVRLRKAIFRGSLWEPWEG